MGLVIGVATASAGLDCGGPCAAVSRINLYVPTLREPEPIAQTFLQGRRSRRGAPVSERRSIEGCLAYLTWLYARLVCEERWSALRGEAARRALAARAPVGVVLEGALNRTSAGFALNGVELMGLAPDLELIEGLRHRVEGWLRPADGAALALEVFAIEAMRVSRTTRLAGRDARSYRSAMPSEHAGETQAWADTLHGSFGDLEAATFVSDEGRDAEEALGEVRAQWLRHVGADQAEAPFLLWDEALPPEAIPRLIERNPVDRGPKGLLSELDRRLAETVKLLPKRKGAPADQCVLTLDPAEPRLRIVRRGAHRALIVRGGHVEIVAPEPAQAIEAAFPPDATLFLVARPSGFDDPRTLHEAARLADPEAMALHLAELSARGERAPWALFWLGPRTPASDPKPAPSRPRCVFEKRDAFVRDGLLPKCAGRLSTKEVRALRGSAWATIDGLYADAGYEQPKFERIYLNALDGLLPLENDRRYRVEGWVQNDGGPYMPTMEPRTIEALYTAPVRAFGKLRVCALRGGEGASSPSAFARVDALAIPDEEGLTLASVVIGAGELFAQERCRDAVRSLRADRRVPTLFFHGNDVGCPIDSSLAEEPPSPDVRDPDAIVERAYRRVLAALAPSWPDAIEALRFAAGEVVLSLGPNSRAWRLSGGKDVHEIQGAQAPFEDGDTLLITSGEVEWPPREAVLRHGAQAFVDAMQRLAHPWGLLSVERGATSNAWLTKLRKVSEEVAASRFDPSALNRPTNVPPGPRRRALAGLRFQSALEAADRGLQHADFVSARPGGLMVVGLLRGIAPYSGDVAADICRWGLSTLLDEPSYGAPLTPVDEEPPRGSHGLRSDRYDLSRWVAYLLDRSLLPPEPGPLVEALAARISALFTRLNSVDAGLTANACGVLACVSAERAWIVRRGLGRVVLVRGRRASIVVPEDTLARDAAAAGHPVESFMRTIPVSLFDEGRDAQPAIELGLERGDRLVFLSSEGFELEEPAFFPDDDGAPSVRCLRDAIVGAKLDGWGFVAVDVGFEGR